jgi:hypothetical protein
LCEKKIEVLSKYHSKQEILINFVAPTAFSEKQHIKTSLPLIAMLNTFLSRSQAIFELLDKNFTDVALVTP